MSDDADNTATPAQGGKALWIGAGVALFGLVVAGLVLGGGSDADTNWSSEQQPKEAVATPIKAAAAANSTAADAGNQVYGIIKSKQEATIASRVTARIIAMPHGEGDSFPKGALLARFDCSQIQAQLNAARAAVTAYRTTYETNVELDEYKAIGKNDVAVSQANLGKASAEARAVEAQLSDCAVYAPFAGKVQEEIANVREIAASGQPLLKIQSGGNLEIELIVPSRWLTWLRPSASFVFRIDETGQEVKGTVSRLGAAVDAVSKTIRINGDITESNGIVLPGMSGTATFADAPQNATGKADTARTGATTDTHGKPS